MTTRYGTVYEWINFHTGYKSSFWLWPSRSALPLWPWAVTPLCTPQLHLPLIFFRTGGRHHQLTSALF